MQEPIDLGAWLVEHPAASYVMRVNGHSMSGCGINDGDLTGAILEGARWLASAMDREEDGATYHGIHRFELIAQVDDE